MLEGYTGLLQPWGALFFVALFAAAYFAAYRWQRARPGRPRLHLDVAAIGLLALLTGGFFWRVLTESGVYMPAGGGDLTSLYFPTYTYLGEQIKQGVFPLWNPNLFSGMPLTADVQSGAFYPLNWILFLFVKVDYGPLEWYLIIHYWLASVFTYLFLRDLGLRRLGSLTGAVVFAFCGFMVAHLGHMPMILVATWIPLTLLAFRRALVIDSLQGWAWAIAAGLFAAISLLAGHVQIFAYGVLAAGLLWLYFVVTRWPRTVRQRGVLLAKALLLLLVAIGIGAIQFIPSVELSSQSVRSAVSYEEASEFPAQPVTLLNLVLPRVYGSSPVTYSFSQWQNTENWGYCGVITLALAAAALALRRNRMVGFFAILLVVALVIMVGDLSIVGAWLYKFAPGFNKLRDAGRALVLLGLGLSGLAAYGMDGLLSALAGVSVKARRVAMWWLVGLSAAVLIALLFVLPLFYSSLFADSNALYGPLPGAINDLGMAILWLGVASGIGWAAFTGRLHAIAAGALIFILLVLDIFSPNSRFNPTTANILAGYQHFDAYATIDDRARDPNTGIPFRVSSDTDVQDVWQPSSALLWSYMYDTGGAFNPLKLERYDYLWETAKRNPDTPLYDLTGASLEVLSTTSKIHQGQAKWLKLYNYGPFDLWQNKNALPRLFLVHESRIETDPHQAVDVVRRFDVDPRHTVVLDSGQPVKSDVPGTAEARAAGTRTDESVKATHYTPDEVDITVQARAPGWVVLSDAYYPGWEATVDGRPATILPAYYAYRAVAVDKGSHTITMRFRPASFTLGAIVTAISAASAAVALAALLMLQRQRRRRA